MLAIDIEVTGKYIELTACTPPSAHDEVFAVGACVLDARTGKVLQRRRWVLQLKRNDCDTWEQVWRAEGYEMFCFEQFWSKYENILDALMMRYPNDTYPRERRAEMWRSVGEFVASVQRQWPAHMRVSDTMDFDLAHCSNKLVALESGFMRLWYDGDPKGTKKAVGHLGTVRDAALGLRSFAAGDRTADEKALVARHRALAIPAELQLEHSHDPQDDAECIARQFAHYYHLARWTSSERLQYYGADALSPVDRRQLGL